FSFADGYRDPTGLLYLINRYYDPSTAQFISVDPLVGVTGQAYSYAGNDPVNGSDPLGLFGCSRTDPLGCVGNAAETAGHAVNSGLNSAANWLQQSTFLGHSTIRLCVGVSVAAVFGFNASGCIGETDLSQQGISVSGGPSLGLLASGGPSISFSGACASKQIGGPFWGVTGGAGPGGSYEWGTSQDHHIHVFSYGPAVGLAGQRSWTATFTSGGPSCGC
ncbi:MAG: RHS repeat-associated core domain-containing protein, partial [Acidimicrobiales bacterium]